MGKIIRPDRTDLGDESFVWMVGSTVSDIVFIEPYSWRIHLSNGGLCSLDDGNWRLSTTEGVIASSDDHGHQFGLPRPVDARAEALERVRDVSITRALVREEAPDLILHFDDAILELLALSSGYECWQVRDPSGRNIVVDGRRNASTWGD